MIPVFRGATGYRLHDLGLPSFGTAIALLRNLLPSLKPGGTVVIVDPDPIKNRGGKSPENRSPDQIRREAEEAGFEVVRIRRS